MTAREVIKALECCDLDAQVVVVAYIPGEDDKWSIYIKPAQDIITREDIIEIS